MSYIANELLMPRKKYAAVPQNVVSLAAVDAPAQVIAVAEITDVLGALNETSPTGGAAIKSRPTNGVSDNGRVYDGESGVTGPVCALTPQEAWAATRYAKANNNAGGQHHIAYISPDRHSGGAITSLQTDMPSSSSWKPLSILATSCGASVPTPPGV